MVSYQASDYTEKELIEEILGLKDPTDGELEARIVQMIDKYDKEDRTSNEKMLYDFFNGVYSRFFTTEEDQQQQAIVSDADADENIDEEYQMELESYVLTNTDANGAPTRLNTQNTNRNETSSINANANNIRVTKQVDLIQGKVNPLLLQTIRRVISIDSQYRPNPGNTLPAEFTFNLSDPLRDVVSLKLYSIGIPYTWYTVNDNFGSNFFFIQGNAPGINSDNYKFQISIPTGNYSANELISTINTDLQSKLTSIPIGYDMSFGNTRVSYNRNRSRSTMHLEFSKTHTESSYDFTFSKWTSPEDTRDNDNVNISNAGERYQSIPGFLGFNQQNYILNSFRSARTIPQTANDPNNHYYVDTGPDTSNNYFHIIHYCGTDTTTFSPPYSSNSSNSIVKNKFRVTLPNDLSGNHTRAEIVEGLDTVLQSTTITPYLNDSQIQQININDASQNNNGMSYFDMTLNFNRTIEPLTQYSKMHIEFPDEAALNIIDTSRIWVGDLSACLGFSDLSYNNGEIYGESEPIIHDTTDPTIRYPMPQQTSTPTTPITTTTTTNTLPYYEIRCAREGFDVSENNFAVSLGGIVPTNTQAIPSNVTSLSLDADLSNNALIESSSYQYFELFNALSSSLTALKSLPSATNIFDQGTSFFQNEEQSHINFQIKLSKSFTSNDYQADTSYNSNPNDITDISNSFLQLPKSGNEVGLDLSQNMLNIGPSNIFTNSFDVTETNNLSVAETFVLKVSPKGNNGNQDVTPYIVNIHDFFDKTLNNNTQTVHETNGIIQYDVSYDGQIYDISFDSFTSAIEFKNDSDTPIPVYLQLPGFFNYMFDNFKRDGKKPLQGTKLEIKQRREGQNDFIDISFVVVVNEEISTKDYEIQFFDPTNMPNQPGDISHNFYSDANDRFNTRAPNFWVGDLLFDPSFVDVSGVRLNDIYDETTNPGGNVTTIINNTVEFITAYNNLSKEIQSVITIETIEINEIYNNHQFIINAYEEGVTSSNNENNFIVTIPNGVYRRDELIQVLNNSLIYNSESARNSAFHIQFEILPQNNQVKLSVSGYKFFNVEDLKIIFYDGNAFAECYAGVSSIRSATSDATLGWLMGFRNKLTYELNDTTITNYPSTGLSSRNNVLSIEGDSVVSTDLYNKLFIVLDDYNQSRLNDGLITNITNEDNIALPSYATRNRIICHPVSGEIIYDLNQPLSGNVLSENRVQAAIAISDENANTSSRQGGKGPFAKDVFAVIPIKTNSLNPGQVYTEFGGTLQNQERVYFGPVNISRMSVKLMTDRGDVVDLNGADWTFSLIAEQLYQSSTTQA